MNPFKAKTCHICLETNTSAVLVVQDNWTTINFEPCETGFFKKEEQFNNVNRFKFYFKLCPL